MGLCEIGTTEAAHAVSNSHFPTNQGLLESREGHLKRLPKSCMHDYVNTGYVVIFEWDDDKATTNLLKHGVAFELAEEVWDDPAHIIVFDRHENNEERWHAIGLVRAVLILAVVHTYPANWETDENREGEEQVRIVSARKATRDERKRYEAQND